MADEKISAKWIADQVRPALPRRWRIVPHGTNLDDLDTVVVMLIPGDIWRTPGAPQSHRTQQIEAEIISPVVLVERRTESLLQNLHDFLDALDNLNQVKWVRGTRGITNNLKNIGYKVTLEIIIEKEEA